MSFLTLKLAVVVDSSLALVLCCFSMFRNKSLSVSFLAGLGVNVNNDSYVILSAVHFFIEDIWRKKSQMCVNWTCSKNNSVSLVAS